MTSIFYWVSPKRAPKNTKGNMIVGTPDHKFMIKKSYNSDDKMIIEFNKLPFDNYTDGMIKSELKDGAIIAAYNNYCLDLMFPERKNKDEKVDQQPKSNF